MTHVLDQPVGQDAAPSGLRGLVRRRRAEKELRHAGMIHVRRMSLWRSKLLAFVGLVVVLGLALGLMAGAGAVVHALVPRFHFDTYAALDNQIVVFCVIGLSILWLLLPHPWAKELVEVPTRDDPAPRFAEPVTGKERVVVNSVYESRAPPVALSVF